MRLVLAACRRGVAAVIVTHDAQLASWADRVVFLRDGRVVDQTRARDPRVAAPAQPPVMSTTLLERPVEQHGSGNGGVPARRAVTRWAWRLFRREWRQQLLVLAMIVVAVAATVVGAAVATNSRAPADLGFGTAQNMATFRGTPSQTARDVAAMQQHFGRVDIIVNRALSIPGSINTYEYAPRTPRAIRTADARPRGRALPHRRRRGGGDRRRGISLRHQDREHLA